MVGRSFYRGSAYNRSRNRSVNEEPEEVEDDEFMVEAEGLSEDSDSINEDDLRSIDVWSSSSESEEIDFDEINKNAGNDLPVVMSQSMDHDSFGHKDFKKSLKAYSTYKKSLATYSKSILS